MFTKRYGIAACLIVASALCSWPPAGCAQGTGKMALFNCKEGSFSVMMPGEPKHTSESMTAPAGPTVLHSYEVDEGETVYLVTYSDYPTLDAAKSLEKGVKELAKALDGKVVSDKSISVNGRPGRRVRVESKEMVALAMIVISGKRMYQVLFGTPVGAEPPPKAEEFLSSFKIL
jgi:hypothetical protein